MPYIPFYRKPLPALNAPALNNALEAANSGMLYSITGAGYHILAPVGVAEPTVTQTPAVVLDGIGGISTFGSYGSQSLTDPNAVGRARRPSL